MTTDMKGITPCRWELEWVDDGAAWRLIAYPGGAGLVVREGWSTSDPTPERAKCEALVAEKLAQRQDKEGTPTTEGRFAWTCAGCGASLGNSNNAPTGDHQCQWEKQQVFAERFGAPQHQPDVSAAKFWAGKAKNAATLDAAGFKPNGENRWTYTDGKRAATIWLKVPGGEHPWRWFTHAALCQSSDDDKRGKSGTPQNAIKAALRALNAEVR